MSPVIQLRATGGVWTDYSKRQRNRVFLGYALDFLQTSMKAGSPLVRAYLLGHALELLLKTYLLTTGDYGERALKDDFRHNLSKLLSACGTKGLGNLVRVSPELVADLKPFSDLYRSKALEYFSILYLVAPLRIPDTRRVARFTHTMARALQAYGKL